MLVRSVLMNEVKKREMFFRSLRGSHREMNGTVVVNLGMSLLLLNISFIVAALRTRFNESSICDWVALSMHYFTFTSLLWFFVDAVFLIRQISRHLTENRRKFSLSPSSHVMNVSRPDPTTPNGCCISPIIKFFLLAWGKQQTKLYTML